MSPLFAKRKHRARGQAASELAVMGVVLVPIFFYAVSLQDLLLYKLDAYETITSSPWDGQVQNYQTERHTERSDLYQGENQSTWADHTSADRTGPADNHEGSIAVMPSWSKPLDCKMSDVGIAEKGDATQAFYPLWRRGGGGSYLTCEAEKYVRHKFIPYRFLNIGSGGGEGGWAQANVLVAGKSDAFKLLKERFSVLHGTLPINDKNIPKLEPNQDHTGRAGSYLKGPTTEHVIFDRSAFYYDKFNTSAGPDTVNAGTGTVLDIAANADLKGDYVPSPPMHWEMADPRPRLGHYSSGWSDGRRPGGQRIDNFNHL